MSLIFNNNAAQQYGECGTYGGAVVHFLPHVVADALQLRLCDLVHRPHHMLDGLLAVEDTTAGLQMNRNVFIHVHYFHVTPKVTKETTVCWGVTY